MVFLRQLSRSKSLHFTRRGHRALVDATLLIKERPAVGLALVEALHKVHSHTCRPTSLTALVSPTSIECVQDILRHSSGRDCIFSAAGIRAFIVSLHKKGLVNSRARDSMPIMATRNKLPKRRSPIDAISFSNAPMSEKEYVSLPNAPTESLCNLPATCDSPSMSRRRLASGGFALGTCVRFDHLPSICIMEPISSSSKTKITSRNRELVNIPSPLLVPANIFQDTPLTPVGQTIPKPLSPQKTTYLSTKKTVSTAHNKLIRNESPLGSPELTSISWSQLSLYPTENDSQLPITPIDQVMSTPISPPLMPRRSTHVKTDAGSVNRNTSLIHALSDGESLSKRLIQSTSPDYHASSANATPSFKSSKHIATSTPKDIVPYIDIRETPHPVNRKPSGQRSKSRPAPLFLLPNRASFDHQSGDKYNIPSPISPLMDLSNRATKPLASPYTGYSNERMAAHTLGVLTPFVETKSPSPNTSAPVPTPGTPSYFQPRSYFS